MNEINCLKTYAGLKVSDFLICQGISFRNDRYQVNLGVQSSHDFNIQRLERVSSGLNEVNTSMDAVVNNVHTIDLIFSIKVSIKALFDIINNWAP